MGQSGHVRKCSEHSPHFIGPPPLKPELKQGVTDDRLAALRNILPTLLDLCGSPVPESVEGCSLISETRRNYLLGEHWEDENSIRMVVNDRYKLIWYPVGNRFQLFDVIGDPMETNNLAGKPEYAPVKNELTSILIQNLHGSDERWIDEGKLTGEKEPDNPVLRNADRTLRGQRGWR